MNRRTLLKRSAAAGTALSLAGCLRRGGEDEDALNVSSSDATESEDGNLLLTVTVSNPTDREASGTLYINSEIDDEALTRVREVSLDPHSTTTVRVEYDIQYREITSFSYNTDLVEN